MNMEVLAGDSLHFCQNRPKRYLKSVSRNASIVYSVLHCALLLVVCAQLIVRITTAVCQLVQRFFFGRYHATFDALLLLTCMYVVLPGCVQPVFL